MVARCSGGSQITSRHSPRVGDIITRPVGTSYGAIHNVRGLLDVLGPSRPQHQPGHRECAKCSSIDRLRPCLLRNTKRCRAAHHQLLPGCRREQRARLRYAAEFREARVALNQGTRFTPPRSLSICNDERPSRSLGPRKNTAHGSICVRLAASYRAV